RLFAAAAMGEPSHRFRQREYRVDRIDERQSAEKEQHAPAQIVAEDAEDGEPDERRQQRAPDEDALVEKPDAPPVHRAQIFVEERRGGRYLAAEPNSLDEAEHEKTLEVPGEGG